MLHWRKKRCCDVVLLWQRLQKMGWLLLGFQNTVRRIVVNIPSNKMSLWCHWFDSFPARLEHQYQREIKRVLKKLIRNSTILIRTGTFGLGRRGGGRWSSCPKKLHNGQVCKRWNWETKLQEKQKGLQFSSLLKHILSNLAYSMSSIDKPTQSC